MNESKTCFIYGLFEPGGEMPMYVGKGTRRDRPMEHWRRFIYKDLRQVNGNLATWFDKLKAAGKKPSWRVLEDDVPTNNWEPFEIKHIAFWKEKNSELCNILPGGNCPDRESQRIGGLVNGGKGLRKAWVLHRDIMLENQRRVGRIGLEKARKSGGGLKRAWQLHPELMREHARRNALLATAANNGNGGKRAWELHADIIGPVLIRGSELGRHNRWHVKRGVTNPDCDLCVVASWRD